MVLGFLIVACILWWLSIWAGVAKIKKTEKFERKKLFHKLLFTMGLPATVGLISGFVTHFTKIPDWVSIIVFVVLNIVFLFCGAKIARKVFKNDYKPQKKNSNSTPNNKTNNYNNHKKRKKKNNKTKKTHRKKK